MSSLATVNINNLKSTKYGSTEVKKIMRGSDRLWPVFPIVLKLGDNFYNVSGIQNNEYVKTEVEKTRCILGSMYSCFSTNVQYGHWHSFEFCFTSNSNGYITTENGGDTNKDAEIFYNSSAYGYPCLFWDYMASNSSGSGFNRLYRRIDNIGSNTIYDKTNITDIYIFEAETDSIAKTKRFKIKDYGSSTYKLNISKSAYQPNVTKTLTYQLFSRLNTTPTNCMNFYYIKIYDKDKNVLGFYHLKQNGNTYGVYDEITKEFLNYSVNSSTGMVYDWHEYDTFYTDKYIDIDPEITEYYEVSGSITEGTDTYERLVNNVSGLIIKGIKISS